MGLTQDIGTRVIKAKKNSSPMFHLQCTNVLLRRLKVWWLVDTWADILIRLSLCSLYKYLCFQTQQCMRTAYLFQATNIQEHCSFKLHYILKEDSPLDELFFFFNQHLGKYLESLLTTWLLPGRDHIFKLPCTRHLWLPCLFW